MTIEELGDVLAMAAAFDNRTVGRTDVLAWYAVIGHLDATEARQAVLAHYTATTDRVMPAHILGRVTKLRALRIAHAGPDALPDADPDDAIAWRDALRAGRYKVAAVVSERPRPLERAIEATFRYVPSAWKRGAISTPTRLAIEPAPPTNPEFEQARALLRTLPPAAQQHWMTVARNQLENDGVPLEHQGIAILAADLATRPDPEA